jgi:hypothetical protein
MGMPEYSLIFLLRLVLDLGSAWRWTGRTGLYIEQMTYVISTISFAANQRLAFLHADCPLTRASSSPVFSNPTIHPAFCLLVSPIQLSQSRRTDVVRMSRPPSSSSTGRIRLSKSDSVPRRLYTLQCRSVRQDCADGGLEHPLSTYATLWSCVVPDLVNDMCNAGVG